MLGLQGQRAARTQCLCGAHTLTTALPQPRPGGQAGALVSLLPGACSLSKWGRGPRVLAKIWHGGSLGTGVLEDSPRNPETRAALGCGPSRGMCLPLPGKAPTLPTFSCHRLLLPASCHPRSPAVASGTPTSLTPRSLFLICDSSSSHRPPKNPDLSTPPKGRLPLECVQSACRGPGVAPEGTLSGLAGAGKPEASSMASSCYCSSLQWTGKN